MIKLRIPLFIFSLGAALLCSYYGGLVSNNSVKGIIYLGVLVLLVILFEKTKVSERKVNIVTGISIAAVGLLLEFAVEPGDIASLFAFISYS